MQLRTYGAVATAPIRPLAWELPYTAGAALKSGEKKKKKKRKKKEGNQGLLDCWIGLT